MKFYSFFCIILQFYIGTSNKIKPELKKNILSFGYGINHKYKGMLAHLFDRFYVVTKFILPMIGDLKFSKLDFNDTCAYMENKYAQKHQFKKIYAGIKSLLQ